MEVTSELFRLAAMDSKQRGLIYPIKTSATGFQLKPKIK